MAAGSLPPPPINDKPGSFTWLEWYRQLRSYISTSGSVPWYIINFAGSNITDLATYLHNTLQGLQGGAANEKYHLTSAENAALVNSSQGTWTPTFTNLTVVLGGGSVTYNGRYSQIGRTIFFTVSIEPTSGATISTDVALGITYFDPPTGKTPAYNDILIVSDAINYVNFGTGFIDASTGYLYPCVFGPTSNTVTISGKYEV